MIRRSATTGCVRDSASRECVYDELSGVRNVLMPGSAGTFADVRNVMPHHDESAAALERVFAPTDESHELAVRYVQVADQDEAVRARRHLEVQNVGGDPLDSCAAAAVSLAGDRDRLFGEVDTADPPALRGEVDCVAARSASQIKCSSRRDPGDGPDDELHRLVGPGNVALAVPGVPALPAHRTITVHGLPRCRRIAAVPLELRDLRCDAERDLLGITGVQVDPGGCKERQRHLVSVRVPE